MLSFLKIDYKKDTIHLTIYNLAYTWSNKHAPADQVPVSTKKKKVSKFKASFQNCASITVTVLDFLATILLIDKLDVSK
jgi:hypothetical protein